MSGSDSPTFFHGQPWSSWIEKIGRDKPLSDEEPDTEPASSVMRLSVDDIDLYGFCPERDTFYGVVCEICNAIVKPQALIQHMESRHPSGNPNATGQTNNATAAVAVSSTATAASKALMKTPYCKLSKLKKTQSSGQLSVSNSNGTSTNSVAATGVNSSSSSKANSNSNHTPVKQSQPQQSANSNSSPRSPLESCGPGLGGGSPVKSPNNAANNTSNNSSSAQQPKRKRLKTERSLLKDREYDPDRHCGVWNDETGKPCTRSLTCKAHTVSLRRTVAGRSKGFDQLLAEHRASKEPQNQARNAAAAAATAKVVAAAELAVAPSTPAAPQPTNNPELEAPSSPPVLSLPDTYPLPQAVDLLYRCLAPHGSNKPTKLEEDFANELESSRRVDASVVSNASNATGTINATNVNNSTNNSVMAPISVVLPSLSPIQTDGLSPQAPLLQFASRNVGNSSSSPMSADQPASTPVVPSNQQQQPSEAKTAPPMDIDSTGQSITMYTSPASKSQVTVQISRASQRNSTGNYSSLYEPMDHHVMTNGKRAKTRREEYPSNIQLVETVAPYTNFDEISWSNCHPEPLAVTRWLRISNRKQYNFNIH